MNKYLALVLGLLLAFFSIMPKSLYADWDKSNINPISPSTPGIDHIYGPSLLKEDSNYYMYYTSHTNSGWQINFAILSDILNPSLWSNETHNIVPIGTSDNWEKEASDPSVLKIGHKYVMWYTSTNTDHWVQGSDRFRTRRATSLDGVHWTPDDGWVIKGSEGKWDEGGTTRGRSVLYKDGIYHMWYAATNTNDLSSRPFWSIGYATSLDGISWQKQNSGEPIINKTNDWEFKNFSYPNVIYENGLYKMYYTTGDSDLPARIVYAESSNGLTWSKPADKNPIINTSPGFDSVRLSNPFILKTRSQYKLFYSGYNGVVWKMGYATKDIAVPSIPLLKQTSDPWQSQVYDKANIWSPQSTTIYRWGCAITSVAMVLNYYGYEYLPDGKNLDPGTLNTWLKSQPDGYIGQGLVNWQAISRLSKTATQINNINTFDALEFSYGSNNINTLVQDLNNNNPVILEEPGHFIVATASEENTFLINDPYYERSALNEGYNNTYLSTRRYIPSHTDLSYVMIITDPSFDVSVKDSVGNAISKSLLEGPIIDPKGNTTSGKTIRTVYIQKPTNGSYTISVSSPKIQMYDFTIYLYDENGEVIEKNLHGLAHPTKNNYILDFDKSNTSQINIEKVITFDSILKDLDAAYKNRLMLKGIYTPLRKLILDSKNDYNKKRLFVAKVKLNAAVQLTQSSVKFLNNIEYFSILNSDLKTLHSSL